MAMAEPGLFIGLMSGTSLDGVDGVLADFTTPRPRLLAHAQHGFAPELREAFELLLRPGSDELHRAEVAAQHLARAYASVVQDLLLHAGVEAADVRAIGAHGQTVRHRPEAGYTLQLNSPAVLAELTGIDVVADFRSRDIAAGGQGAPLVPAFHAAVFAADTPRAVVNLGGISNVTGIPGPAGAGVTGFDCGPGNVLIDAWARRHLGEPFDRDGRWAASGRSNAALLESMLAEPYFALAPPKSTGRELFNSEWLERHLDGGDLAAADVQATLTHLTARAVGQAIAHFLPEAGEVIVCGGGALNGTLINMLADECAPRPVLSSARLGIDPKHVEALAFAWLARAHLARTAGNVPAVTGARGERVLGALYPA
jgi:anhydro-N-acetylmuramic acid kinase